MNEYREFALTEVPKEEHGNYWCEICFEEGIGDDIQEWYLGRITACSRRCIDEYWIQVRDHPDYADCRGSPKQMSISDAKENPRSSSKYSSGFSSTASSKSILSGSVISIPPFVIFF